VASARAKPYSNAELAGDLPELPERGKPCPCGVLVPDFEGLTLRAVMQMKRLRDADDVRALIVELTGCPRSWADIWVLHHRLGCPRARDKGRCPFCGGELRTYVARQCRHCGADWHDAQG